MEHMTELELTAKITEYLEALKRKTGSNSHFWVLVRDKKKVGGSSADLKGYRWMLMETVAKAVQKPFDVVNRSSAPANPPQQPHSFLQNANILQSKLGVKHVELHPIVAALIEGLNHINGNRVHRSKAKDHPNTKPGWFPHSHLVYAARAQMMHLHELFAVIDAVFRDVRGKLDKIQRLQAYLLEQKTWNPLAMPIGTWAGIMGFFDALEEDALANGGVDGGMSGEGPEGGLGNGGASEGLTDELLAQLLEGGVENGGSLGGVSGDLLAEPLTGEAISGDVKGLADEIFAESSEGGVGNGNGVGGLNGALLAEPARGGVENGSTFGGLAGRSGAQPLNGGWEDCGMNGEVGVGLEAASCGGGLQDSVGEAPGNNASSGGSTRFQTATNQADPVNGGFMGSGLPAGRAGNGVIAWEENGEVRAMVPGPGSGDGSLFAGTGDGLWNLPTSVGIELSLNTKRWKPQVNRRVPAAGRGRPPTGGQNRGTKRQLEERPEAKKGPAKGVKRGAGKQFPAKDLAAMLLESLKSKGEGESTTIGASGETSDAQLTAAGSRESDSNPFEMGAAVVPERGDTERVLQPSGSDDLAPILRTFSSNSWIRTYAASLGLDAPVPDGTVPPAQVAADVELTNSGHGPGDLEGLLREGAAPEVVPRSANFIWREAAAQTSFAHIQYQPPLEATPYVAIPVACPAYWTHLPFGDAAGGSAPQQIHPPLALHPAAGYGDFYEAPGGQASPEQKQLKRLIAKNARQMPEPSPADEVSLRSLGLLMASPVFAPSVNPGPNPPRTTGFTSRLFNLPARVKNSGKPSSKPKPTTRSLEALSKAGDSPPQKDATTSRSLPVTGFFRRGIAFFVPKKVVLLRQNSAKSKVGVIRRQGSVKAAADAAHVDSSRTLNLSHSAPAGSEYLRPDDVTVFRRSNSDRLRRRRPVRIPRGGSIPDTEVPGTPPGWESVPSREEADCEAFPVHGEFEPSESFKSEISVEETEGGAESDQCAKYPVPRPGHSELKPETAGKTAGVDAHAGVNGHAGVGASADVAPRVNAHMDASAALERKLQSLSLSTIVPVHHDVPVGKFGAIVTAARGSQSEERTESQPAARAEDNPDSGTIALELPSGALGRSFSGITNNGTSETERGRHARTETVSSLGSNPSSSEDSFSSLDRAESPRSVLRGGSTPSEPNPQGGADCQKGAVVETRPEGSKNRLPEAAVF